MAQVQDASYVPAPLTRNRHHHPQLHQAPSLSCRLDTSAPLAVLANPCCPPSSSFRTKPSPDLPSRVPSQLSKFFVPVSMSISIDNPLIFVYPKSFSASDQSQSASPTNDAQTPSGAPSQVTLFPSFRPQPSPTRQQPISDNQIIQSSAEAVDCRSTILSGSLILKFSKPKEIRKIIISLCGQSYIGFNDRPYEYQTILDKELEIDLAAQLLNSRDQHPAPGNVAYNSQHKTYILDKGNYRFHWSFILPPDLPPYERGQFGRTTHKVVAKVKLGSGLGLGLKSVGKNLPSIIFGVGHGGHEIETESYFVAITYPSRNNEDVSENLGLNLNVTEQSEQLGPYSLSASSCYFTVAGLLSFKFKLTDIPQKNKIIKIYKITCLIKQQYRLISMKDKDCRTGGPAESWPPCQRRRVFVLDHSNAPSVKSVLSNGKPFNPSGQSSGDHCTPDFEASAFSADSRDQATSTTFGSSTIPSSPETSRSHSRSRSQFRGFLPTPARSRERRNPEGYKPSSHAIHSWNNLPSIKLGRRREESSRYEAPRAAQEPRLYSSRSVDSLGNNFSLPSQTNQTLINSGPSSERDNASASLSRGRVVRRQKPSGSTPNCEVVRHSEDSAGSRRQAISGNSSEMHRFAGAPEAPAASVEQIEGNRGREPPTHVSVISSGPSPTSQNSRSQTRSKSRPGHKANAHLSHIEKEVPLITLTDKHMSWEIEHMARLPTDDIIRPSTNPGTQTNIHIFHTLLFEICYGVEDDTSLESTESGTDTRKSHAPPSPANRKILSIRKPVQISSCCCMVESMVLPPYSKLDPNAETLQHPTPSHAARMLKCVCDMSTDVLLKTQNPQNPQANSNPNGQAEHNENSDNTASTTHSTLRFRSKAPNSSVDQSSLDQDSHSDHSSQDFVPNSLISTK